MAHEKPIRLRHLVVLLATLMLWTGSASAAPENIERLSSATSLDEAQVTKINEYASYWADLLQKGDSEDVREARNRLVRPLRIVSGKSASLLFRTTYGKALLPKLREIVKADSRYQAINALQIATALSTPAALALLDEHLYIDDEPRPEVRLWSVIGVGRCINDDAIRFDKIKGSLRNLSGSAQVETNPLVLQRAMETLNEAVLNTRPNNLGGPELRSSAITFQNEVLTAQISALEESKASPEMVKAFHPALILIRNQYINPNLQQEQRTIGLESAPLMGRIYTVVLVNKDALRADPQLSKSVVLLMNSMESTLKLIDSNIRPNQASPDSGTGAQFWSTGNIAGLELSRDEWKKILTAAPYKQ